MRLLAAICLSVLLPLAAPAAELETRRNPDTGLLIWKLEEHGISLELMQLHPDFVRAIYGSRGFPKPMIEEIAGYCVFGTILRNVADAPMEYRVADWRYIDDKGDEHSVKTKTQWTEEWRAAGVPFLWSLLPDHQSFGVGDWNQGFTTIELPRESEFDLVVAWKVNDEAFSARMQRLKCAPEELPEVSP